LNNIYRSHINRIWKRPCEIFSSHWIIYYFMKSYTLYPILSAYPPECLWNCSTWYSITAVIIVWIVPGPAVMTGRPGLDGRRVSAQRHRVGISGWLRVSVWRFAGHSASERGVFPFHFVVISVDVVCKTCQQNTILSQNYIVVVHGLVRPRCLTCTRYPNTTTWCNSRTFRERCPRTSAICARSFSTTWPET